MFYFLYPVRLVSHAALIAALLGFIITNVRAADWVTLEDCRLIPNQSNDGDSFHVRAKNKEYIFRLYLVDAPELDTEYRERVDEQAKYFGITVPKALEVAAAARFFTQAKLNGPFTVRTCMEDARGQSRRQRFYAFVQTKEGDLGEQLVESGLGRVYGATITADGVSFAAQWQKLQDLESKAKQEKIGGWGAMIGRLNIRAPKGQSASSSFDAFFNRQRATPSATPPPAATLTPAPAATPTPVPSATFRPTPTAARSPPVSDQSNSAKLDVNKATQEQLEEIPGIGPVLAGRIMESRPFKGADELRSVKGIGDVKFEAIRPFFQ